MTSVATKEHPRSSSLDGAHIPRFSPPKTQKTPVQNTQGKSNRPRTRSSAQNSTSKLSSSGRSTPRRRKHGKNGKSGSKEASPVIDLTAEEENQPQKRPVPDDQNESPLSNSKRRHTASKARGLTINRGTVELNSSPIRSSENRLIMAPPAAQPMSSPVSRRKIVTFSDDLVPSSPVKPMDTPRKSILKNSAALMGGSSPLDPNNSAMWMKTAHSISHSFSTEFHSPNNPAFWQPGTIIQLEPRSNDLPQLVDGCMEVLKIEDFGRKFEVYATLNQVCKFNDASVLAELFLGGDAPWLHHTEKATRYKPRSNPEYIKEAIKFIRRDILQTEEALQGKHDQGAKLSPSRNDPFQSRVLNQALKFAAQLLMSPAVNRSIPVPEAQWLYSHTCDQIVRPSISKSLVLPYLSIIKDCHFAPKRRRAIFENPTQPVSEKMLSALLNIRNFGSSSLVNEKFIALKNMISNFPNLMAKNFHLWFVSLVLNLCDTRFPLYTKVVSSGITALLEAARNFLDNPDICFAGRQFLESPLPESQTSFTSNALISISTTPSTLTLDYIIESLTELIQNGHHKFAMDIWVGLTLLCGRFENGLENWRYLTKWLQVHKSCFNESDMTAKVIAISSWKVIVYKVCCVEIRDLRSHSFPEKTGSDSSKHQSIEDYLKTKIKLLIHIFVNITSIESQDEIIDALHNSFMTILYNLLNYPAKTSLKLQDAFWDKIIFPVFANFYFKKDSSSAHMHRLGLSIIDRLIKPTTSANDKAFSSIRCLSNEAIQLAEMHSLNPRWIFVRFDKVMQTLSLLFKSSHLDSDSKVNLMNKFMNALKFFTKKEVQVSDVTRDIIDSMSFTLESLSKNCKISYDSLFKLIVNLNDTFGAQNLMIDTDFEAPSCFEVLLLHSIHYYTSQQLAGIITMVQGAIGDKHHFQFLYQLVRVNIKHNRGDLESHISDCLNNRKINRFGQAELVLAGKILRYLKSDFFSIAKRVIQHIVLLKAEEFEKMVKLLEIREWNVQVFKFFLGLMHDAPYDHLKKMSISLLKQKWTTDDVFEELASFLFENNFSSEIKACFEEIVQRTSKLSSDSRSKMSDLISNFLLQLTDDDSVIDSFLELAYVNGLNFVPLFKENLGKFPRLQSLSQEEKGSSVSTLDKSSNEKISQQQIELESLIDMELKGQQKSSQAVGDAKKSEHTSKELVAASEQSSIDIPANSRGKDANSQGKDANSHGKDAGSQGKDAGSQGKDTNDLGSAGKTSTTQHDDPSQASSMKKAKDDTMNVSQNRRRTRRMAAKEREELSQTVVEISFEEEESSTTKEDVTPESIVSDKVSPDVRPVSKNIMNDEQEERSIDSIDSDSIEDSAKDSNDDSDKRKRRSDDEEESSPSKKAKNEKQVSDSEESLKEKREKSAAEAGVVMVDSSMSSSERRAEISRISESSEKQYPGTFLDSSVVHLTETASCELSQDVESSILSQTDANQAHWILDKEPVSGPETDSRSIVTGMLARMAEVDDEQLSQIPGDERYKLETAMMEFILRMRKHST